MSGLLPLLHPLAAGGGNGTHSIRVGTLLGGKEEDERTG